jgi:hypothetical protein
MGTGSRFSPEVRERAVQSRRLWIQTRRDLLSRSQATLVSMCAVLRPRGDLAARHYGGSVLLPSLRKRKLPRFNHFKAQWHGF